MFCNIHLYTQENGLNTSSFHFVTDFSPAPRLMGEKAPCLGFSCQQRAPLLSHRMSNMQVYKSDINISSECQFQSFENYNLKHDSNLFFISPIKLRLADEHILASYSI